MLQLFRTTPHSLCSSDATARTIQRSAQRSTVWVKSQTSPRRFWPQSRAQSVGVRARVAISAPIRLTHRDTPHQPKSFSIASVFSSTAPGPSWPHPDLGHQRDGRELPAPTLKYPLKCAFFGHLSSSPHRSRAAPFFRRLDTLTIQDGRTGVRMTASGLSHLSPQAVVNPLPGPVQTPVAEVGVDGWPGWQIMRQQAPLTARAQDIEDGIDNLPTPVISRTPSAFDGRNQWFDDLPFDISQVRWVVGSLVHATILPLLKQPLR